MTESQRPGEGHNPADAADFPAWLNDKLDLNGWTQADFSRASGLAASIINRYLKGVITPNIENARMIAEGLGIPLLEVLVAAGQLTKAEASDTPAIAISADDLPDAEIVRQVQRRFQRSAASSQEGHGR